MNNEQNSMKEETNDREYIYSLGLMLKDILEEESNREDNITSLIHQDALSQKLKSYKSEEFITSASRKKLDEILLYINTNYKHDISRESLAYTFGLSPDYMGKQFKLYTGKKISRYINELRINEAIKRLNHTRDKINSIGRSVGFANTRTFNRVFYNIMKTTPSKYRLDQNNNRAD